MKFIQAYGVYEGVLCGYPHPPPPPPPVVLWSAFGGLIIKRLRLSV